MKNLKSLVENYSSVVIISETFFRSKAIINKIFDNLMVAYNAKISRSSDHSCINIDSENIKCKITALSSSSNSLRGYRPDLFLIDKDSLNNAVFMKEKFPVILSMNSAIYLENF